jgi:hypothetical protein
MSHRRRDHAGSNSRIHAKARISELYGPVLHHRFADKNTVFTLRKDNALNSWGDKITIADKHPDVRLIAIRYFDPFVGR